jgi:hypothetical protein
MAWHSHVSTVRRSITAIKVVAVVILVEQGYEMLFLGVSLAEHPIIVIAALGALGFPVPSKQPERP